MNAQTATTADAPVLKELQFKGKVPKGFDPRKLGKIYPAELTVVPITNKAALQPYNKGWFGLKLLLEFSLGLPADALPSTLPDSDVQVRFDALSQDEESGAQQLTVTVLIPTP